MIDPERYVRNPKRKLDRRPLHLKIRVVLTRAMSEQMAFDKLMTAAKTGVVPSGIEVRWIDWEKGKGGDANAGRLTRDKWDALKAFYYAIVDGHPRFEPVRPPSRPRR